MTPSSSCDQAFFRNFAKCWLENSSSLKSSSSLAVLDISFLRMSVETFSCVRCIAEFLHNFYYDSYKPPPSSFLHWIELCLEMKTVAVVRITREKEADVVRVTREKEADVVRVTREKEADVVEVTREKEADVVRVTREKEAHVVRVTREKEADVVRVTREKEADVARVTREKEAHVVRVTREKEADVVRVTREKEADVTRVTREKEADVVSVTREKEADVARVTDKKEATEVKFKRLEDTNCTCAPFQGVGFCEVTSATLHLSQFCVTKEYRSRGLSKQIALYFISKYSPDRVMFWSINPDRKANLASVVTRRFVVKLRDGAEEAPKTAGIFSGNRTDEGRENVGCDEERVGKSARLETFQVEKRRRILESGREKKGERSGVMASSILGRFVTMATVRNNEHLTIGEASTIYKIDLHKFILEFQQQWRYFKPISYNELNILLSCKYRDIVRVITVKKCAEGQDEDGNNSKEDIVGIMIMKILAVTTRRGERKTAILSHISWDITLPSLPSLLLNTSIQLSRDLECHVLLCNECCGLGGVLEGDTRFRDMREVGVENKVSVWESGQLVMGVGVGEFGMTLFE